MSPRCRGPLGTISKASIATQRYRYYKRQKQHCIDKMRLTMEEAAVRFGTYPPEATTIYVCEHCTYLHFTKNIPPFLRRIGAI